jgi:hypothetical protein
LARIIQAAGKAPRQPLDGFTLSELEEQAGETEWGELRVALTRGAERLVFYVRAASAAAAAFHRTDRFALLYDRDTPPDAEGHERILRGILEALERRFPRG